MTAEQKAEEIANKRCHEIMCFGHCNFSSPKHHRCGEWHREYNCALDGYHEGFKDCAKARLNVTTISDCPIKDEAQGEEAYKELCENYSNNKSLYTDGFYDGYHECQKEHEWHDLKKDPNDLPKDDKEYLVIFCYDNKGAKRMCYEVRDNLQHDFEIHRCYTEQIIAWKEIVPPKEIE